MENLDFTQHKHSISTIPKWEIFFSSQNGGIQPTKKTGIVCIIWLFNIAMENPL